MNNRKNSIRKGEISYIVDEKQEDVFITKIPRKTQSLDSIQFIYTTLEIKQDFDKYIDKQLFPFLMILVLSSSFASTYIEKYFGFLIKFMHRVKLLNFH